MPPRSSDRRILVVGTTSDYVDLIREHHPGRALFLTDRRERARAREADPGPAAEVLCDLANAPAAHQALRERLAGGGVTLAGITCFDCESLPLAADLASAFGLDYASPGAVAACRSKFTCKQRWQRAGVPCPDAGLVRSEEEALIFWNRAGGDVVLKPLTGCGSALTFRCRTEKDCREACRALRAGLASPPDSRLYATADASAADPRRVFAIEEFVAGPEFSCDFTCEDGRVEILRLASKVPAAEASFGTTLAYLLPARLPGGMDDDAFRRQLGDAARAVGLRRSIAMVDFIVKNGRALMIEIAPRPGGDCLPPLFRHSSGMDMLGLTLDFAEGRDLSLVPPSEWTRLVGLRLLAKRAGVIRTIDAGPLARDARVRDVHLKVERGHRVTLPPDDYDSRVLGHVVFDADPDCPIEDACRDMAAGLRVTMEGDHE